MLSLLRARMGTGLVASASLLPMTRFSVARPLLSAAARSFATSRLTFSPAAAATKAPAKKAPAKKAASVKKPAAAKKPVAKSKVVAKKKVAPKKKLAPKKKKVVVKKPVVKKKKPLKKAPKLKEDGTYAVPYAQRPPKRPSFSARGLFLKDKLAGVNVFAMTPEERKAASAAREAEWQALTPAQLKVYADKGEAIRTEYENALTHWYDNTPRYIVKQVVERSKITKGARLRRPRDTTKPKMPLPPFMKFASTYDAAHPAHYDTFGDRGKAHGVAWKALSEAERDVYKALHESEMVQYRTEIEEWKKQKQAASE